MKNLNLKIGATIYLLVFVLLTGTLFAQNTINITGTYEGLRSQFDRSHKKFTTEFQYKYELTQDGDKVEGISTIISPEGNYAEVGIKGIVVGDKFYFEEYRMIDEIIPENFTWCYKYGILDITKKDNEIVLSGETPSYMVKYGYACTGGFTKISGINENTDNEIASKKLDITESNFDLVLFPNPTVERLNFSFSTETESNVVVEIIDMAGKRIFNPATGKLPKGSYLETFNVSNLTAGIYIFKIQIGDKVYSKEFVKS